MSDKETLQHQLRMLGPELKEAKADAEEAASRRKALEKEALDKLREQHKATYDREAEYSKKLSDLTAQARDLSMAWHEVTGETGNFLDGWYQITAPEKLSVAGDMEESDVVQFIVEKAPFLMDCLRVDMKALDNLFGGNIPSWLLIPVRYMPQIGSKIMWSKITEPETAPDVTTNAAHAASVDAV